MSSSDDYHPSFNDSDGEAASTDSGNSLTSNEDSTLEGLDLPERLFATDSYPVHRKINSYSKTDVLIDILYILDGTPEYDVLVNSCFGKMFSLPATRCSLAGKLVHNFLCRQLRSDDIDEVWFTFAGRPLRFSIAEFSRVTGLPCGQYPLQSTLDEKKKYGATKAPYWYTLIGPNKNATISDLMMLLKTDKTLPGWRRLQLVLVVLVDGLLCCATWPTKPTDEVVEMVKDTDFFLNQYPLGRKSFELTIEMIKVGKKVENNADLIVKLKQSSLVLHGCPVVIQLFLFRSVPSLAEFLPSPADTRPFIARPLRRLKKIRCFCTGNILVCENNPETEVKNICKISKNGYTDAGFGKMVSLLESGYAFTKRSWKGGDRSLPRLCVCKNRRPNSRCKCGSGFQQISIPKKKSVVAHRKKNRSECTKCDKLEKTIHALRRQMYRSNEELRSSILNEVRYMLSSHGETSQKRSANCSAGNGLRLHETNDPGENNGRIPSAAPPNDISSPPVFENKADTLPAQTHSDAGNVQAPVNGSSSRSVRATHKTQCSADSVDQVLESGSSSKREPESGEILAKTNVLGLLASTTSLFSMGLQGKGHSGCVGDPSDTGCMINTEETHTGGADKLIRSNKRKESAKTAFQSRQFMQVNGKRTKNCDLAEPAYNPFEIDVASVVTAFKAKLQGYTQTEYDLDGLEVPLNFFTDIATPQKWLSSSHINFMIRPFWNQFGKSLLRKGKCILDTLLTQMIASTYCGFKAAERLSDFQWHSVIVSCIKGEANDRPERMAWFTDVHTVYTPMNWGKRHLVGLAISLNRRHIDILDPMISLTSDRKVATFMSPVVDMLPHVINATCDSSITGYASGTALKEFTFERLCGLGTNKRGGDCAVYALKFMEMHALGLPTELMGQLSDDMMNGLRMNYSIRVYEEFVARVT